MDETILKAKHRLQRCDWRQRPLSLEMQVYARQDTHFLLYIYDRLKQMMQNRLYTIPETVLPSNRINVYASNTLSTQQSSSNTQQTQSHTESSSSAISSSSSSSSNESIVINDSEEEENNKDDSDVEIVDDPHSVFNKQAMSNTSSNPLNLQKKTAASLPQPPIQIPGQHDRNKSKKDTEEENSDDTDEENEDEDDYNPDNTISNSNSSLAPNPYLLNAGKQDPKVTLFKELHTTPLSPDMSLLTVVYAKSKDVCLFLFLFFVYLFSFIFFFHSFLALHDRIRALYLHSHILQVSFLSLFPSLAWTPFVFFLFSQRNCRNAAD